MSIDLWEAEGLLGGRSIARVVSSRTALGLLDSQASSWLADTDVLQIFLFMGTCEESSECLCLKAALFKGHQV